MRRILMSAAIGLTVLAPAAALADSITWQIGVFASGPDSSPWDHATTVPTFDPSLGTLTGQTLTFAGYFTPGENWPDPSCGYFRGPCASPVPVTLTPKVALFEHHPVFLAPENVLATYNAPGNFEGYNAIGTPEGFSVTASLGPDYEYVVQGFFDVWAGADWPKNDFGEFGADLGVLVSGLTVTDFYTPAAALPEPATLPLLALGLAGLVGVGWRKAAA